MGVCLSAIKSIYIAKKHKLITHTSILSDDSLYTKGIDSSELIILKFSTKTFNYDLEGVTCEQSKFVNKNTVLDCQYSNKSWMIEATPHSSCKYSDNDYNTVSTTLSVNDYTHSGFVQMLAIAWASEFGIQIRPEMFHHLISCELSREITKNPSRFRDLYTNSTEKTTISVTSLPDNCEKIVDLFDSALSSVVPNKFFKGLFTDVTFKSQPINYPFVKSVSFCKSATPYYDCVSTTCGFPSIEIVDDIEDWTILLTYIEQLMSVIPSENCYDIDDPHGFTTEEQKTRFCEGPLLKQLAKMKTHIKEIVSYLTEKDDEKLRQKMQKIFFVKDNQRCMSGHSLKYYVYGWICDFYIPPDRYNKFDKISDFPVHLPYVPFRCHDDDSYHAVITGLTNSIAKNNILISGYGVIHLKINNAEIFEAINH